MDVRPGDGDLVMWLPGRMARAAAGSAAANWNHGFQLTSALVNEYQRAA
jgi:hypothetical protein